MNALTRSKAGIAGVSIFEMLVASVVLLIAITGLYTLYFQSLRTMKTTNEASLAQIFISSQLDQLRNCGWATLSGSNGVMPTAIIPDPTTDLFLKSLPSVGQQLISVYPAISSTSAFPLSSPYYTVSRSGTDIRKKKWTIPTATNIAATGSQSALTFVFNLQWTSQSGTHSRESLQVLTQPIE